MKAESPELPTEIMELQMGPSHPATHGTIKFNPQTRRRKGARLRRRSRISPPRLRQELRASDLDPGHSLHRPAELRLVADQQRRLLRWPWKS